MDRQDARGARSLELRALPAAQGNRVRAPLARPVAAAAAHRRPPPLGQRTQPAVPRCPRATTSRAAGKKPEADKKNGATSRSRRRSREGPRLFARVRDAGMRRREEAGRGSQASASEPASRRASSLRAWRRRATRSARSARSGSSRKRSESTPSSGRLATISACSSPRAAISRPPRSSSRARATSLPTPKTWRSRCPRYVAGWATTRARSPCCVPSSRRTRRLRPRTSRS